MKVNYDQESGILYIIIKEGPIYDSVELDEDIKVEYDKDGRIIGIEIMDARRNIGKVMAEEIANRIKAVVT